MKEARRMKAAVLPTTSRRAIKVVTSLSKAKAMALRRLRVRKTEKANVVKNAKQ